MEEWAGHKQGCRRKRGIPCHPGVSHSFSTIIEHLLRANAILHVGDSALKTNKNPRPHRLTFWGQTDNDRGIRLDGDNLDCRRGKKVPGHW